jgi:hypothetical protein
MRAAYDNEKTMRKTWEKLTAFCIKNKKQIKLFWNDADSQKNGFLNDGVVVGQTWDGPPLSLKTAGEPVTSIMPAPRSSMVAGSGTGFPLPLFTRPSLPSESSENAGVTNNKHPIKNNINKNGFLIIYSYDFKV